MSNLGPTLIVTPPIRGDKTVVILGAFRGGTSMITAAVDALGVPMRDSQQENDEGNGYDNWEDSEFQEVLHANGQFIVSTLEQGVLPSESTVAQMKQRLPDFSQLVEKRNASFGSWGWKYPGTSLWVLVTDLIQRLRNPHVITVFRDPLAIWQHETLPGTANLKPDRFRTQTRSFSYATVQNEILARCAKMIECPQLVVSSERASKDSNSKQQLVTNLREFLQTPNDELNEKLAVERMSKSKQTESTRPPFEVRTTCQSDPAAT